MVSIGRLLIALLRGSSDYTARNLAVTLKSKSSRNIVLAAAQVERHQDKTAVAAKCAVQLPLRSQSHHDEVGVRSVIQCFHAGHQNTFLAIDSDRQGPEQTRTEFIEVEPDPPFVAEIRIRAPISIEAEDGRILKPVVLRYIPDNRDLSIPLQCDALRQVNSEAVEVEADQRDTVSPEGGVQRSTGVETCDSEIPI